ncbi:flagellin [Sedimenticola hydrogenitrophicus]|uniref:flagellin N-terminal helical domain-containing protein n=1 Tax=Sedimenticola hydrogenitrophicus TaxID=2967975 RepID=UPI0023AE739B|nr:flagellin [Sedimenticola hydrogenitrophicus]
MAQIINTNIASLTAQRNLNKSQSSLATAMERLSSGLRINSAKDDAAGLAISERMTTQVRGMNQAIRNSNDGISLSQTAEGAMGEITENMQRIRELAVQSRNATNNAADRQALDAEVQQRLAEIDRIATQTQFNGTSLLDGSFTSKAFQVGANVGQTISISAIANAQALSGLGLEGASATAAGTAGATIVAGSIDINGTTITTSTAGAADLATAINASGVDVTAAASNATTGSLGAFTTVAGGTYALSVDGVAILDGTAGKGDVGTTAANVDTAITAASAALTAKGITTTGTAAGGDLAFVKADGTAFDLAETWGAGATAGGFANAGTLVAGGSDTTTTTKATITLTSGADITVANDTTASGLASATAAASGTLMNILTTAGADNAITKIDAAMSTISGARANMGAVQSRFESAISSLSVTVENLSAARSRITDADFAAETAQMTRSQILQQAGVAMVSQANALPQSVLSLLQ